MRAFMGELPREDREEAPVTWVKLLSNAGRLVVF
jgi:hypothetical protein